MNETTRRKFTQSRWFIFLVTYIFTALVLGLIALDMGDGKPFMIPNTYFYGGLVIAFICALLVNPGVSYNGRGRAGYRYYRDHEYFKKVKAQDKPFERVILPIMAAGVSLALTGLLLLKIIF